MKWTWLPLVFVLPACFSAHPPDGSITCGPEPSPCPTGYRCARDNTCRSGKDPDLGPCTKTACISDDFNDGVQSPIWSGTYRNSPTLAETDGRLEITYANPTPTSPSFSGYKSAPLDLTGSYVAVEVLQVPSPSTTAGNYLSASHDDVTGTNNVAIGTDSGMIVFGATIAGTAMSAQTPYSATLHRWWRIRESSGTVFFETAPDGKSWTQQYTAATPSFATSASVELGAGSEYAISNAGGAAFDNFNLLPP